jgi:hypothetical protein
MNERNLLIKRTVGRNGITYNGLTYWNVKLMKHIGETVQARPQGKKMKIWNGKGKAICLAFREIFV